MWPSEIRVKEGLNPDRDLDALAEKRRRPGEATGAAARGRKREEPDARRPGARADHRHHLRLHDTAMRLLRRERDRVEKLAKKHADDVDGWHASLRDFFAEHAGVVAETMRIDLSIARAYAAQHGTALQAHGIVIFDEHWERREAEELAALALDQDAAAA
jgi:hypothetical protein